MTIEEKIHMDDQPKKETVFLSGKITGDPDYRQKFCTAAAQLEKEGYIVLNPALLPSEGFTWEAYMRISDAMLRECDAICFLSGWEDSRGAQVEHGKALALGKRIFCMDDKEREKGS